MKYELIRNSLGVEIYVDEYGIEYVTQPNGDLIKMSNQPVTREPNLKELDLTRLKLLIATKRITFNDFNTFIKNYGLDTEILSLLLYRYGDLITEKQHKEARILIRQQ